jgi:hypothetical protein
MQKSTSILILATVVRSITSNKADHTLYNIISVKARNRFNICHYHLGQIIQCSTLFYMLKYRKHVEAIKADHHITVYGNPRTIIHSSDFIISHTKIFCCMYGLLFLCMHLQVHMLSHFPATVV